MESQITVKTRVKVGEENKSDLSQEKPYLRLGLKETKC